MKLLSAAHFSASDSDLGRVARVTFRESAVWRLTLQASGRAMSFSIPESRAQMSSAKASYGLAVQSGLRSSKRRYSPEAAGTRMSWERLLLDHEMYFGALCAPKRL